MLVAIGTYPITGVAAQDEPPEELASSAAESTSDDENVEEGLEDLIVSFGNNLRGRLTVV